MPYPYLSRKDVVNEAILKASRKKTGDKFTLPDLFRNTLPSGVTEWEQIQTDFNKTGGVISGMFAKNSSSPIMPLPKKRKKNQGLCRLYKKIRLSEEPCCFDFYLLTYFMKRNLIKR